MCNDDFAAYEGPVGQAIAKCSDLLEARRVSVNEVQTMSKHNDDDFGLSRPTWITACYSHNTDGPLALWRDALRDSLIELNLLFKSGGSESFHVDLEKLAICFTKFAMRAESCLLHFVNDGMATERFNTADLREALNSI